MPVLGAGYIGDYAEDYTTLNLKFSTFTTGWVPVALAGTPIISIYTGSATGTEVTTGVTHVEDFDGITGLNNVLIDLSSAAFYAVAADYHIVITQGTIDSVDATGTAVGSFSIENRKSKADVIEWLGTAVTLTASIPDVNIHAINGNTAAAAILKAWIEQGVTGTSDSGTTTTLVDSARTQADDYWKGAKLIFRGGTNVGRTADITDFDAASDTLTFAPAMPDAVTTETYVLIPGLGHTAAIATAVWDRVISMSNHNIGQSAGKILRQSGDLIQIDGAVSDASPSTTDFDTNLTQIDGYFDDSIMIFANGAANAGIGKPISAYLNSNGNVTFVADLAWPVTPVNGDDFVIVALHEHPLDEVRDAIWAKTMTELGAVPGVTGTTLAALEWLFLLSRNKGTQTSTTKTLRNDADDADIATAAVSSDSVTFTREEWG